jgi:hypothetical protein
MSRAISLANHLVAVFDDHAAAAGAARALSDLGIHDSAIHLLHGDEGARAFDSDGHSGRWLRLSRLSGYFSADQSSDYPMYDAAIKDGRTVLAVHLPDRTHKAEAIKAVLDAGGHFINFYGRLQTEEINRWRGPELVLPDFLPPPRARKHDPPG